jgi:hypothetical protein
LISGKEAVEIQLAPKVDNFVCNYLYIFDAIDCNTFIKPRVFLVNFQSETLLGLYYPGTGILLLNRRLKDEYINQVMAHELVHHYGFEAGVEWGKYLCSTEEKARRVEALFSGRPYTDSWRKWYGCEIIISF